MAAGWTEGDLKAQSRRKLGRDSNTLHKELLSIFREIERQEYAWPFREPVDLELVPDYTKIIAHPIGA